MCNRADLRLVLGPCGSGKTTYVSKCKGSRDLVIDLDAIARALSGEAVRIDAHYLMPYTTEARAAILKRLLREHDRIDRAYVITTATEPTDLARLLVGHRPKETIVMDVEAKTCIARCASDVKEGLRPCIDWEGLINKWFSCFGRCARYASEPWLNVRFITSRSYV